MENQILSAQMVADCLGVDKSTLIRNLSKTKIPYYRINRMYKFRKSDVEKWLDEHTVNKNASA
jgi:excisionase family DNA binding protein